MPSSLKFIWIIGLVVAVAASVMLVAGAIDPNNIPAPRQAPVPLSSLTD